MSHNIMDDPLFYVDDITPSGGVGGDDLWGTGGDVDVELLADAFFDNAGDFGIDSDPVAQQIIGEERDSAYELKYQPQDLIHHQVVTPPSTSPLLVMGGMGMGNNTAPMMGTLIPDTNNSIPAQQPRLSFQPTASVSSVSPFVYGNNNNSNHNAMDMARMMQTMMAAAAAANNNSGSMDSQQQPFIFAANSPASSVGGLQQQQVVVSSGGVDNGLNPFLALATGGGVGGGGMAMIDRAQFLEATFLSRQKGRRQMSSDQANRRRERNRQLAKKTRDKKKDYMGSLQDEILELQRQNAELKAMVKLELDQKDSQKVLESCDAMDKVPETVWEACGTDKNMLAEDDVDMVSRVQKSQTAFIITDPSFDDNPIVFCSPDFLTLTGYSRDQVIGRNCRFLQGPATCPTKVANIRKALVAGDDVGVTLINYKADGTPFWNRLFIAAVRDINDQIVNFMGVTVQVSRPEPEDPEHDMELPE